MGTPYEMAVAIESVVAFFATVGLFCAVILWATRERK